MTIFLTPVMWNIMEQLAAITRPIFVFGLEKMVMEITAISGQAPKKQPSSQVK
jgi:hypothetical protein